MDLDDFRSIVENTGLDVWTFIEAAIDVASLDYADDLKIRRDRIIERLYANSVKRCRNCNHVSKIGMDENNKFCSDDDNDEVKLDSPLIHVEDHHHEDEKYEPWIVDVKTRILNIKEQLEDPEQSEEAMVDFLQDLTDMDVTFRELQDTDIGRHVNRLRKHSSSEIQLLVKQLVRRWKDIVDEWVRLNPPEGAIDRKALALMDGDSPQTRLLHNGNHTQKQREKREGIDLARLDSARKRLQQNYQDAQNAKKNRTIRQLDIHEIPKPRNGFILKNKARGGRHW